MRNKNLWIIVALAALIALAALVAPKLASAPSISGDAPVLATAEPTDAPATVEPTDAPAAPAPTDAPTAAEPTDAPTTDAPSATPVVMQDSSEVKAYLLVTVGGLTYQPLALTGETDYRVTQPNGAQNVIHVTPTSVEMKSSTCDNQDCVHQGVITLDNMDSRILGNMIICLPNQVTLELYTPEGIYGLFAQPSQEP